MEFDEIVMKESPGLCRCCLSEGCYKDMGTEYAWMNENEVYADMLLECFDISISQHHDGPNGPNRLICEVCITRLRDACYFKKQVLDSEKKFIDMVGRGEFRPKAMIIYQQDLKAETSDEVKVIFEPENAEVLEEEYLEDEMEFGDDEPLKSEDPEPTSSDVTAVPLPVRGKRGRPRKTPAKPEKKKVKTEPKAKSSKALVKDKVESLNGHKANRIMRRNLEILLNNTTVIPFKWRGKYICFYCAIEIENYDQLKEHTRSHGKCTVKDPAIKCAKGKDSELKFDVSGGITCLLCDELFPDLDNITLHLSCKHKLQYNKLREFEMTAYRLADFKCIHCDEQFENLFRLIQHCNRNHAIQRFICDECGQSFGKKRDIRSHIYNYHRQEYVCKQCNLKFASKIEFSKHNARPHHAICEICFEKFPSDRKRLLHMQEHFKKKELKCGFCKRKFETKLSILNHFGQCKDKEKRVRKLFNKSATLDLGNRKQVAAHAKNNIVSLCNMTTAMPFKYFKSMFKCFFCLTDFPGCDELKTHVAIEHPVCCDDILKRVRHTEEYNIKVDIASLSCKICQKPLNDIDTATTHIVEEHDSEYDRAFNTKLHPFKLISEKFPCLLCDQTFKIFRELLKHDSVVHSKNITVCMYCGRPFKTLGSLRVHIGLKHHPGGYKCSICNMECATRHLLGGHMAKVHGKKNVKCRICEERFPSSFIMKNHMVKAHGEGHRCHVCGQLFSSNFFMTEHIRRAHLKEKNAQCSICSERFFDKRLLKIHMVKHVGDRKFSCDICDKRFLWRKNLRSHMKSHVSKA